MIRFNYDVGGHPTWQDLGIGEFEYNVPDGKLFTIDKHKSLIEITDGFTVSNSNARGHYIKHPDGTLIQYRSDHAYGAVPKGQSVMPQVVMVYPVSFVGEYSITVNCNRYGNAYGFVGRVVALRKESCNVDFHLQSTSVAAGDLRASFIAVGRWK